MEGVGRDGAADLLGNHQILLGKLLNFIRTVYVHDLFESLSQDDGVVEGNLVRLVVIGIEGEVHVDMVQVETSKDPVFPKAIRSWFRHR